ncbi:hypothetical protein OG689_24125 [Kitasatospora sp. NBC_00240]|uniref:hypothetical protein n=1 Tax=Kitasatospora sp. NBC_00240 TaxID=2903567 RepID=UPI0022585B64|nr:hypothetical protein [Kitasatospora sp. NBC_00240]MCX5212332.1 hypothetical protein [Kitasatospora sp. NBC_00240]
MPSDRIVALGVVATLVVFGAAVATLDVRADPGPQARPGSVAPATTASRPARQVLLTAAQGLDDAGSARLRTDREGPLGRGSAEGTLSWGAADAADLRLTDAAGAGRLRVVDGVCYLAHDGTAGWRRADRAEVESLDPSGAGVGGYAGGWLTALVGNPGGRLRLVALAGRLGELGPTTENGVVATHYRGSAPVAALFGADQNLSPERRAVVLAYYQAQGVETLDYDIWIGEGDQLLRLRESASGRAGTEVTSTAVSEPGVAFEVRAPGPADFAGVPAAG